MKRMKLSFQTVRIPLIILAVVVSQGITVLPAFADSYVTFDSWSGNPGTTLTVSGGGWNAGDSLNIYLNSVSGSPAKTINAGTDGSFSTQIQVTPNAPQGPFSIFIVDPKNNQQASNSFYVVPLTPSISVTAPSHAPYGIITVSGSGFAPNESVTISLAGATSQAQADASGSFKGATLAVPAVQSGLYNIRATGNASGAMSLDYLNYFWIDRFYPSVTPSSYYVMPGGTLSFSGSGFASKETVTVTQPGSSSALATFTTNSTGSFTNAGTLNAPAVLHGKSATFTLTGSQSHASASTNVTIGDFYAYASPSAYWLLPGGSLSFSGGGFAGNEMINIYRGLDTTPITTLTTDTFGNFSGGSVNVPFESANSTVSYRLVGVTSNVSAQVGVAVGSFYPSISPSSYYVEGNSTITVTGSGFAPNESVSIVVNNAATTTQTTADKTGAISASVLIPFTSLASSLITATGAVSHGSAGVTVTMATYYPSITPSSYYIFPGQQVTYSGSGFVPNEAVAVTYASGGQRAAPPTTVFADAKGSFVTDVITIPFESSGTFSATFTGNLSNTSVRSDITVGALSAYLTSDAYSASPGDVIHVTGVGFGAGEQVKVQTGAGAASTTVATVTANPSGTAGPVAITAPFTGSNLHIVFTGVSTGVSSSLDVSLSSFYPTLTSDNYYTSPGSTIHIGASGFAPNESIVISGGNVSATSTADVKGNATIPVTLPFTSASQLTLTALGQTSLATASLLINFAPGTASVSPDSYYISPGSTITFTGTGFVPNENVSVSMNKNSIGLFTASSTGAFTYSTQIPLGTSGLAHFVFTSGTSNSTIPIDITLAQFYSGITLSTYYAQGGTPLTISGNGFGPNEQVTLTASGSGSSQGNSQPVSIGTANADNTGAFTYSGQVPFMPSGKTTITAKGSQSGSSASTDMTVAPVYSSIQLGSYAGAPGSSIIFIGSGYLTNEPITVTTDRGASSTPSLTYSFNADNSGSFNNSGFTTPQDMTEGNLVLTITGTHSFSTNTITYYVTGK